MRADCAVGRRSAPWLWVPYVLSPGSEDVVAQHEFGAAFHWAAFVQKAVPASGDAQDSGRVLICGQGAAGDGGDDADERDEAGGGDWLSVVEAGRVG